MHIFYNPAAAAEVKKSLPRKHSRWTILISASAIAPEKNKLALEGKSVLGSPTLLV